jgi:NAD(P)-dependent dehydrogenase (short-subunit alcohol dehydrogenase family)
MSMTLQERRIAIFGATSGIGFATAKAAHDLDADIILTARDARELADVAEQLGGASTRRVDATDREQLDAFFAEIVELDDLVLSFSAGPAGAGPLDALDLTELRMGFEGKFWPYVATLQAALGHLRPGGSITLVSAASAGAPLAGTAGLAAINGALEAMVPALAVELKPIRVNAISPGVVDTPFWAGMSEQDRTAMFDQYATATPVGRIGTPEDVAGAIVSVIANGFITGTVQTVDGGLTLAAA